MELELGVTEAHPLKMMWLQVKTIFLTWMHARKHGICCSIWYGVYEKGTENKIAQFGNGHLAIHYAIRLIDAENKEVRND